MRFVNNGAFRSGHNKQQRKLNMYRFVIAYRLFRDVE